MSGLSDLEGAAMMGIRFSDLWRWDGDVGRGAYVFWGLLLFAIKYNLDRLVAWFGFHRHWDLMMYISPMDATRTTLTSSGLVELSQQDTLFYATMLSIALPFIYTGVVLTIRRLRSADLPVALVLLFFIPIINYLLFTMMSLLPPKDQQKNLQNVSAPETMACPGRLKKILDRVIPENPIGSALLGIFITAIFGLAGEALSVMCFDNYGWGLFVGLPFCLGMIPVLIDGYHQKRSLMRCLVLSWVATFILAILLIAVAVEGLICILMMAPIALVFASVGAVIGYLIQSRIWASRQTHTVLLSLFISLPLLMGAEARVSRESPVFAVRTAIDIQASPQTVWHRVVTFSELPPPTDPLFIYGIAYPIRAEIHGHGVGAIRHCVFSTGPFVEPIQVWDEPRLLKFAVTQQPPAMKEFSPYPDLDPPHVDNYLRSQGGQFLLTPLPNGGTHLEGTTWYTHKVWPAPYWQAWSDTILHQIHKRVLKHIKNLAEQDTVAGPSVPQLGHSS